MSTLFCSAVLHGRRNQIFAGDKLRRYIIPQTIVLQSNVTPRGRRNTVSAGDETVKKAHGASHGFGIRSTTQAPTGATQVDRAMHDNEVLQSYEIRTDTPLVFPP